jgi:spore germination protein
MKWEAVVILSITNVEERGMDSMGNDSDQIAPSLTYSQERLQEYFHNCSDIVFHNITFSDRQTALLVYLRGITKLDEVQDHVIPLIEKELSGAQNRETMQDWGNRIVISSELHQYTKAVEAVLNGNAIVLLEGSSQALQLTISDGPQRAVQEPSTEAVVRGPREGFTERIGINLALLRMKLKTHKLKTEACTIGELSKTKVVVAYIEGIAGPELIREVKTRLSRIEIDAILESGYIEEFIEDQPLSPFPQIQYTERPDTTAGQLLEGKFAIFVDGTPFVLMGPITFWQMLKSNEDYYERYYFANVILWLRYIFLFVALFTPALYVAITTFHQDMLPTSLVLSIAAAREPIPFPALIEALLMEVAFEALREAGLRLPKTVGQAVSILGALVIGQAAVQAGIVSAPMVIVVSLTGIASFTIPRFNFAITIRLLRFPLMILAGFFGLYGIIIGTLWIFTHLCYLKSFGLPYLFSVSPPRLQDAKDTFFRAPWWSMLRRPSFITGYNRRRMKALRRSSGQGGGAG